MATSSSRNSSGLAGAGFAAGVGKTGQGAGFTLIEMLVTLALVTILIGLALVTLPAFVSRADLDGEASRLESLLKRAQREALLDSLDHGFRAGRDGYELLAFDHAERAWTSRHEARLPAGLELQLRADGNWLELEDSDAPPVLILSSGEMTPFVLRLAKPADGLALLLRADGYGGLAWEADE